MAVRLPTCPNELEFGGWWGSHRHVSSFESHIYTCLPDRWLDKPEVTSPNSLKKLRSHVVLLSVWSSKPRLTVIAQGCTDPIGPHPTRCEPSRQPTSAHKANGTTRTCPSTHVWIHRIALRAQSSLCELLFRQALTACRETMCNGGVLLGVVDSACLRHAYYQPTDAGDSRPVGTWYFVVEGHAYHAAL